jgi:radical SAM superfamily enzyme YgiQ (UPF0313 family)
MKIKFFTSVLIEYDAKGEFGNNDHQHIINPSYLYLKHFYSLHGKCSTIEWLMPEFFRFYSVDEALQIVKDEAPDVLALSMFIDNFDFHLELAKAAKEIFPNIKIVMGGPQLGAHKTPGFFKDYNHVDYVVYGDGEQAFTQLIDFFAGIDTDKTKWVNIVENSNGTEVVYPYESLTDQDFFSTSPYVDQKQFLIDCLNYTKQQHAKQVGGKYTPVVTIEFARGCMYSCTFCDWSQNLTKKVKRGKRDFFKDIDLFYDLDMRCQESDANFGQWDEDLRILDYAISRYNPDRQFRFSISNTPKLKKTASEYIIQRQFENYPITQRIAMQDMDDPVLKNIDRPSISRQEYYVMINRMKSKISSEAFERLSIQLIAGLPGQSFERAIENIIDMRHETGLSKYQMGHWVLLENSPANDLFYQKTHKLKFEKTYHAQTEHTGYDLELLYQRAAENDLKLFYTSDTVINSGDMDYWEIQKIKALYRAVTEIPSTVFKNKNRDQIKKIIEKLAERLTKIFDQQKVLHLPLMEKYNLRIAAHYDEHNKKIYRSF